MKMETLFCFFLNCMSLDLAHDVKKKDGSSLFFNPEASGATH